MKLAFKALKDFNWVSNDGEEFSANDILFDDESFNIDYVVCRFGGILHPKSVLVSSILIDSIDMVEKRVYIDLDSRELKDGPNPEFKLPVSKEKQKAPAYFHYPFPYFGSFGIVKPSFQYKNREDKESGDREPATTNRTRSSNEVSTYRITSFDEEDSIFFDWILDTESWKISDVCVQAGHFWNKDYRLVPVTSIREISFLRKSVSLILDSKQLGEQAVFHPEQSVNPNKEITYYDYFGKPQSSETGGWRGVGEIYGL